MLALYGAGYGVRKRARLRRQTSPGWSRIQTTNIREALNSLETEMLAA